MLYPCHPCVPLPPQSLMSNPESLLTSLRSEGPPPPAVTLAAGKAAPPGKRVMIQTMDATAPSLPAPTVIVTAVEGKLRIEIELPGVSSEYSRSLPAAAVRLLCC